MKEGINALAKKEGVFLSLRLTDVNKNIVSDNLYWLPDEKGVYSGLKKIEAAQLMVSAKQLVPGKVEVTLNNPPNGPVAFFNRLSLIDADSHNRLLPVFYSDNYVSVLPGEKKAVIIEYDPAKIKARPTLSVSGWNVKELTGGVN